jgi:hypothetical protein
MSRVYRGLAFVAAVACCACGWAQATANLDEPPPPKPPEKGDISKESAIKIAKGFLGACGVAPSNHPPSAMWQHPRSGAVGGTWVVRFGNEIAVGVNARTGHVMDYAHYRRAEEVSKMRMHMVRSGTRKPVSPAFVTPKSVMTLSAKSTFWNFARQPAPGFQVISRGFDLRAVCHELPYGRPIVNAPNELWADFDPRDGSLIGFARSGDFTVPVTSPKVDAAKAAKIAKSTESSIPFRTGQPSFPSALKAPALGYALPAGDRGRPDRSKPVRLVWVVPMGEKEAWVDALTGSVIGGRRYATEARAGQPSRQAAGGGR